MWVLFNNLTDLISAINYGPEHFHCLAVCSESLSITTLQEEDKQHFTFDTLIISAAQTNNTLYDTFTANELCMYVPVKFQQWQTTQNKLASHVKCK